MPQRIFVIPGLPKLNPGLKFANTFGVSLFLFGWVEGEATRPKSVV
jgi:hypothetical protein